MVQWCNEEYDDLIEEAAENKENEERKKLYDEAQRILTEEDVAIVPYGSYLLEYMVKPYVAGFEEQHNASSIFFNKVEFIDNIDN